MLLYASCTLATDDTLIDRVIAIAVNVNNSTILQMHFDAATTSTHVTGGSFHLVPSLG